ncbi:MAG: hypothetical protein QOE15_219 [Acidimicrobiaceae bacterium]|nr:hypothetical protein [Acidimicrobiaceae bacterium]
MTAQVARPPASTSDQFRLGYRPALDGLRAAAILVVVAVHATYLLVPTMAGRFVPGGFVGVDVFFVLSGFLITSLLLEEWDRDHRISLRGFYRRRALRLFPALWFVMVVQLGYALYKHLALRKEAKGLAAIGLYVGNWSWRFGAIIPDQLGQTWSLAVEEQFYLFWPLLLLGLLALRNRRLSVGVMVGLAAIAFVARIVLFHAGVPWNEVYVQTEGYLDALMIGALLAWALHSGWRPGRRIEALGWLGAAFIAAVVLTTHREDAWLFDGGYTLVALASALVICAALNERSALARLLAARPARELGRLSYSIYLWHVLIFMAVADSLAARSGAVRLVVGLSLTGLASGFSYYVIERPFLRRKRQPPERPAAKPEGDAGSTPAASGAGPGRAPGMATVAEP